MPIITTTYRGTPARPYAERLTRVQASGGDIYVITGAMGIGLEIHPAQHEAARLFLSDIEARAASELLSTLPVPHGCRWPLATTRQAQGSPEGGWAA